MAAEQSDKKKLYLAGILIVIAIVVAYFQISSTSVSQSSIRESVRGQTYNLTCKACGQSFEMDAVEYMDLVGDAGAGQFVQCKLCGAERAWKTGAKLVVPDASGLERFDLTTLSGIEDAKRSLNVDYADLQDSLHAAERSQDEAKIQEVQKKIDALNQQRAFLDQKWDEEAMRQGS